MEKIKKSRKYSGSEFLSSFLGLIMVMMMSIAFQALAFRIGSLYAIENLGFYLDGGLFAFLFIAAIYATNRMNGGVFKLSKSKRSGAINLIAIWIAVFVIYIYVLRPIPDRINLPEILVCLLIVLINLYALKTLKADTSILILTVGITLIYCVGTYFAMLINSIEPVIDIYSIAVLASITLIVWLKP